MPKKKTDISPEAVAIHEAAMERIKNISGARTQVQLAEVLDVRQSSISDAKRRASIPPEWLLKLMRTHQVMPDWILTGQGPKYLGDAAPAAVARVEAKLNDMTHALQETADEITVALHMARETIKGLQGQVRDLSAELTASNFTM
jgi:Bacteriophage CI repressor helix-turn-helix domain.